MTLALDRIPRRLWITHPANGGIPTASGIFKPLRRDDFERPDRRQPLAEFIDECLRLNPHILGALRAPCWRRYSLYDWTRSMRRRAIRSTFSRGRARTVRYHNLHPFFPRPPLHAVARRGPRPVIPRPTRPVRVREAPGAPLDTYPEGVRKRFASEFRAREQAVLRREQTIRRLLGAGWRFFTPQDWAGGLFEKFLSFYAILNSGVRVAEQYRGRFTQASLRFGSQRTIAFKLWLGLGMPHSRRLNQAAHEIVSYILNAEFVYPRTRVQRRILRTIREFEGHPETLWQVIAIYDFFLLPIAVQRRVVKALRGADHERRTKILWVASFMAANRLFTSIRVQERRRRLIFGVPNRGVYCRPIHMHRRRIGRGSTRRISRGFRNALDNRTFNRHPYTSNPVGHLRVLSPWSRQERDALGDNFLALDEKFDGRNLDELLAIPDLEFIAKYAPRSEYAWLLVHGWIPKAQAIRETRADVICKIDLGTVASIYREIGSDEAFMEMVRKQHESRRKELEAQLASAIMIEAQTKELLRLLRAGTPPPMPEGYAMFANEGAPWPPDIYQVKLILALNGRSMRSHRRGIAKAEKQIAHPAHARWMRRTFETEMGHAAVSLAAIFGKSWRGWLQRMKWRGVDTHDATHWLAPVSDPGLADYLRTHWQADLDALRTIVSRWRIVPEEDRGLPVQQLILSIRKRQYGNVQDEDFAVEAAIAGLPDDRYAEFEAEWLKVIDVTKDIEEKIPEVTFEPFEGWIVRKLARDDPRVLFAGSHSGCCQNVNGAAAACAWHSAASPSGCVYAIEDEKKKIVAQAWTWRSGGTVVFDSIEAKFRGEDTRADLERRERILRCFEELAEKLKEAGVSEVRCGAGHKIPAPAHWTQAETPVPLPKDFPKKGYSDANKFQYVVQRRPVPGFLASQTILIDPAAVATSSSTITLLGEAACADNLPRIRVTRNTRRRHGRRSQQAVQGTRRRAARSSRAHHSEPASPS